MIQLIAGAIVLGVGAYLLDDASSSNERARRDYDDACDDAKGMVKRVAYHAQKKDALDKSFKMKKAKRKVADAIYEELKKTNKEFDTINGKIIASKEALGTLFEQKKATEKRAKKIAYQEKINKIQAARKELFTIKDTLSLHQKELRARLKLANQETRMVQDEINRILN